MNSTLLSDQILGGVLGGLGGLMVAFTVCAWYEFFRKTNAHLRTPKQSREVALIFTVLTILGNVVFYLLSKDGSGRIGAMYLDTYVLALDPGAAVGLAIFTVEQIKEDRRVKRIRA